jgi:hypothetical protein
MDILWKLYDMYCDIYHHKYYLIEVIIQAAQFYKLMSKSNVR